MTSAWPRHWRVIGSPRSFTCRSRKQCVCQLKFAQSQQLLLWQSFSLDQEGSYSNSLLVLKCVFGMLE